MKFAPWADVTVQCLFLYFCERLARKMKTARLLITDMSVPETPDLPRVEVDCTQVVFLQSAD